MYDDEKNLVIIKTPKYDHNKVNLNDMVKVKIYYSSGDIEEEILKLTGKYIPSMDGTISEISLNSPLGEAIYLKNIGEIVFYEVGNNRIKVEIVSKE